MRWAAAAIVAALTAAALVFVPQYQAHAARVDFPPPGGPSQVRYMTDFPGCSTDAQVGVAPGWQDAVGLGWSGQWRFGVTNGATVQSEGAFYLPCRSAQNHIALQIVRNRIGSAFSATLGQIRATVRLECMDIQTQAQFSVESSVDTAVNGQTTPGAVSMGTLNNAQWLHPIYGECLALLRITVSYTYQTGPNVENNRSPLSIATWSALNWTSGSAGWVPVTNLNQLLPAGVELPIICEINNSGDDIFEVVQNFLGSLIAWPACMLIPVGWDRADRIGTEWERGPGQKISDALEASMPNTLACGVIVSIPFYDQSLVLDSCGITFIPSFVKDVFGAICLLLCAIVIWRRITWSLGSGA